MKKLIFMTLAALSFGAFGITADEAIASKNWYVINDYCKTNNLQMFNFIAYSNNVDFATFKAIYDSYTNSVGMFLFKFASYDKYNSVDVNALQYLYILNDHRVFKRMFLNYSDKAILGIAYEVNTPGHINHLKYLFTYNCLKEDCAKYNYPDDCVEYAIKVDNGFKDNTLKDLLFSRNLSNLKKLDIAIAYNDVDKMIDALLNADSSITAKQVEAIITPINAVELEYRKSDILKVLNNINSWCTIKLYDDQATWEPLLAKIRAMISVRK